MPHGYVCILMALAFAGEKERIATEKLQAATRRANAASAAVDTLREECAELQQQSSSQEEATRQSQQQCKKLEEQLAKVALCLLMRLHSEPKIVLTLLSMVKKTKMNLRLSEEEVSWRRHSFENEVLFTCIGLFCFVHTNRQ